MVVTHNELLYNNMLYIDSIFLNILNKNSNLYEFYIHIDPGPMKKCLNYNIQS